MIITKHEFQLRNQLKMISSTSSKHPHPHPILKEKTFILAFFWKKMGFTFTYRFPIFLTFHRSHPPFGGWFGNRFGPVVFSVHSTPPWPWLLPSLSWSQAPFWRRWFWVEKLFFVSLGFFSHGVLLADFFSHGKNDDFFLDFCWLLLKALDFFGGEAALGCFFCFFCSCCWYL